MRVIHSYMRTLGVRIVKGNRALQSGTIMQNFQRNNVYRMMENNERVLAVLTHDSYI